MTLWHGRFQSKLDPRAWDLNVSLPVDKRLALQDVQGSIAWANALAEAGVIQNSEAQILTAGLKKIFGEFEQNEFEYQPGDEDIHTAVERRLVEICGPVGGKLHTGRSRNDQVSTDFRLWMLDTLPVLDELICDLQKTIFQLAMDSKGILLPGYTHLQRAQPILLTHWWMSFFWPLKRDRERLTELKKRVSVLPLGCGALAGTAFPIDREKLASELGFDSVFDNSLDAVSDRDFVIEFLFCASTLGIHLSKLSETLVLFTSAEFGFFSLSDEYSTGSSLMPQKKNPDLFELTRGKAGTLIGHLTGMLATLKGLPSTYDKDLQEDKRSVFEVTDTLCIILPGIAGALQTIKANPKQMTESIDDSLFATDVADYLVRMGVPFREAHGMVGKAVRIAEESKRTLRTLTLDEWQSIGPFKADIVEIFDLEKSISHRNCTGGTGPDAVSRQLEKAAEYLAIEG
jgi:argininosuccinate lyase